MSGQTGTKGRNWLLDYRFPMSSLSFTLILTQYFGQQWFWLLRFLKFLTQFIMSGEEQVRNIKMCTISFFTSANGSFCILSVRTLHSRPSLLNPLIPGIHSGRCFTENQGSYYRSGRRFKTVVAWLLYLERLNMILYSRQGNVLTMTAPGNITFASIDIASSVVFINESFSLPTSRP